MQGDKNFLFFKKVLLNCRQMVNIALRNFIVNKFRAHTCLPAGRAQQNSFGPIAQLVRAPDS